MARTDDDGRLPTIYDVARECGVAASTVSRALSRPGRISAKTSERVREVATRMGYQPNPLARYLPTGRTRTLVLIVSDITNPVYFSMIRGAEAAASEAGYTLVLSDIEESADTERQVMEGMMRTVDGFVLATSRLTDAGIRSMARRRPMVTMNRITPQVLSVVTDNQGGMRDAATHLAELGHQRVTYIAGPSASWADAMRWRALRDAAGDLGLKVRRTGPYEPTLAGGRAAADELARRRATAVIAYNDVLAIGAMQGLTGRGLRIPADVSVVGWDNIVGSDWCAPALTTLASPLRDLGATAVKRLVALLAGTDLRRQPPVVLPTRLVVRESTATAAARVSVSAAGPNVRS